MTEGRNSFWAQLKALVGAPADGEDDAEEERSPPGRNLERPLVANMLAAVNRRAGDIAVPRSDMTTVPHEQSLAGVVAAFRDAGHSRMPVRGASLDEISGMLHVKDIYALIAEGQPEPAAPFPQHLVRAVLFVPAAMPVLQLLAEMRRQRTHMAIVVDEFGGTDGLVTIEDVVEQIVGDIEDEHDEEPAPMLAEEGPGVWVADGRLTLADADRALGTSFADTELGEDVDTLGGLVALLAGAVPAPGTVLDQPDGWRLVVLDGDTRRVTRLGIEGPGRPGAAATGADPAGQGPAGLPSANGPS